MQGWELLKKHDVVVNILCSVHAVYEQRGLDVYRFFRDTLRATFIKFIPIVEATESHTQNPNSALNHSVNMMQFGKFFIEIL
ncbi:MAG: anaerobic sulfatase maturase [Firmicutes bacterium]|nr:anaerobic sulfatase maturase [Bacillota bacterium]